jgi:hypothetical protein
MVDTVLLFIYAAHNQFRQTKYVQSYGLLTVDDSINIIWAQNKKTERRNQAKNQALWTKSHLVNRIIAHVDKALRVYCEADEETVECTNVSADARAADANEDDDALSFVTCSGGSDSESLGDTASIDTRKSYGSDYFSECSEDTGYSDSESE